MTLTAEPSLSGAVHPRRGAALLVPGGGVGLHSAPTPESATLPTVYGDTCSGGTTREDCSTTSNF